MKMFILGLVVILQEENANIKLVVITLVIKVIILNYIKQSEQMMVGTVG